MLHYVNVDSGTKRFEKAFAAGAINDLSNGKIGRLRMFAMEKRRGNPNFIGNFEAGENFFLHHYLNTM